MEYIYKNERIPTHFIKTDKFKTNTISIRFASNIDRTRITERVLIPSLLYAGSKNYNSKRKINLIMEELYDSSISFSMSKMGLSSVISISTSFVSDKYLEEDILDKIVGIMNEVIFNPDILNESFLPEKVEEEKRLLRDYFESIKEDKLEFALKNMKEKLYGTEEFGISPVGYLEDLDKIDGKSLFSEYKRMIFEDSVEVIIAGDFKSTQFIDKLPLQKNFKVRVVDNPIERREYQEITDTMKLSQAVLAMAFRTGITFDSDLYYPMIVANAVLGTSPNNLLFETLREKHSLCYYVRSAYISFNGEMYIYSGLNDDNIVKASEMVLELVEGLKSGDFDIKLLENAKKVLINDLYESLDRQNSIGSRVYLYHQVGRVFDFDEVESKIQNVTKEDVIKVASNIELEMKYALSNKEEVWKK